MSDSQKGGNSRDNILFYVRTFKKKLNCHGIIHLVFHQKSPEPW